MFSTIFSDLFRAHRKRNPWCQDGHQTVSRRGISRTSSSASTSQHPAFPIMTPSKIVGKTNNTVLRVVGLGENRIVVRRAQKKNNILTSSRHADDDDDLPRCKRVKQIPAKTSAIAVPATSLCLRSLRDSRRYYPLALVSTVVVCLFNRTRLRARTSGIVSGACSRNSREEVDRARTPYPHIINYLRPIISLCVYV